MRLKIVQSEDSSSPREDMEFDSIMVSYHRNYLLGDISVGDPIDWLEDTMKVRKEGEYTKERFDVLREKFLSTFIALPIYLYNHSGLTISTSPFSCPWDSGHVGFIYTPKEVIRKSHNVKRVSPKLKASILENMEAQVKEYDTYLRGEIYGYQIVDSDDNVVDSCYGFYGSDHIESGMKDYIDASILGITDDELTELLNTIEIEY